MKKGLKAVAAAVFAAGLSGTVLPSAQAATTLEVADTASTDSVFASLGNDLSAYGLPSTYDERSFQRMLQMAGYDIGSIDGKLGPKTLGDGLRLMLSRYEDLFGDLYDGDPADLSLDELEVLAPAVYQRVDDIGIANVMAESQRWTIAVRAIDSETVMGSRTMVNGEFIIRAPDGRELFIIENDGRYEAEAMTPAQAQRRLESGENIFRPQFNTGGLNFAGNGRAFQDARVPWHPYDGSALPGLIGGTVYGLEMNSGTLNTKGGGLPRGFGDRNGFRSWIRMPNLDTEVVAGRGGFGIHVDGDTLRDGRPNDGTAGCLGVREEYARVFFEFLKNLDAQERPNRIIVVPLTDPAHLPAGPEMKTVFLTSSLHLQ